MLNVKALLNKILNNSIYYEGGTVYSGNVPANSIVDVNVTFAKEFNTTPSITACFVHESGGTAKFYSVMDFVIASRTKTGFKIRVSNADTSAHGMNVAWTAIGKLGGGTE